MVREPVRLAPVRSLLLARLVLFRLISCAEKRVGTEKEKSVKIPRVVWAHCCPVVCRSALHIYTYPSVLKSLLARVDSITSQHSIIISSIFFRNLTPQETHRHV